MATANISSAVSKELAIERLLRVLMEKTKRNKFSGKEADLGEMSN